jgi:hypothetical protein
MLNFAAREGRFPGTVQAAEKRSMKVLLGILVIGAALFWLAINSYRPLDQMLALDVLGLSFLLGGAVLVWAFRYDDVDKSDSYLPKSRYIVVACLPWFLALALLLNALLDTSAPTQYRATVVSKSETSFRQCITVTSWRTGRSVESIPVDAGVYPNLPQSGPIIVNVKPGLLHVPWVVGFERLYRLNVRAN